LLVFTAYPLCKNDLGIGLWQLKESDTLFFTILTRGPKHNKPDSAGVIQYTQPGNQEKNGARYCFLVKIT
jgi:hypothetical protein